MRFEARQEECGIAVRETGGRFFCTRNAGHEGPCAAVESHAFLVPVGVFWVAELVDPVTRNPFAPAVYWNGHTRPLWEAVTTTDIREALKWKSEAACQSQIEKLGPSKLGIFIATEHEGVRPVRIFAVGIG